MSTCGEDEFGNLYADVRREDVGTLRGLGSLHWSYEDDSDSSTDIASKKVHLSENFPTGATKEHSHQCITGAQSKLVGDGEVKFIHSGTSNGVSPAQGASKKGQLTEISNSKHCLRYAGTAPLGAEDVDTDSDDDLHIVLNPLEGVANEGSNEDTEDGEDFVVLAGGASINDQDWQESSCTPLEDKAKAFLDGGEKLGTLGDEKGQNGKSPGVQPRIGYGSRVYHRHYRYVRGSGFSSVGPSGSAKIIGKSDRFSGGRGLTNCQRVPLLSRGTGTFRGLSCGLEYSIPSNKTVFDVDIDALKEKPWRLSHVDVSDYFNFGFDEISWKKYCKQLAQFCLEITTQSKISVFEGGRTEQSTKGALQVGGGCEPCASANTQGLQIRESDAIFLIDVKDDRLSQSCSEDHLGDSGEVNNFLQKGSHKSDVRLGSEGVIWKTAQPLVENANQTSVTRLGAEPQKCGAGAGNETQVNGSVAICPGDGSVTPSALRPKPLSPSTPPGRIPTQDKRDIERGKSQSSSLNDGSQVAHEGYVTGDFNRNANAERKENLQTNDNVKGCGRRRVNALTFCEGNCLSGRRDMKRCSSDAINSPLPKKRRLGLRKVNHDSHHSVQVVKKLSGPDTSKALLRAYRANTKAEIPQPKKLMSINNEIECWNGYKSVGQYVKGSSEQHVVEKAEMKANSFSSTTVSKKSKRHGEIGSSKVKGRLQGIHCKSAEENSKEKLKAKKFRKGRKCKERIKSKGCPNREKGQVKDIEKTFLIKNQGAGNISMISFVSKDNQYYWKKVDNMSMGDVQDQDTKKLKSCLGHKIEQKTEEESKIHKNDNFLLGHVEIGGDEEIKDVVSKLDDNTPRGPSNYWKASQVLKTKKMDAKHVLSGEHGVDLTNTGLLVDSIFETHVRDSMHVAFSEQVSTRQKWKHSENKERQLICKQSHLEAEDKAKTMTDLAVSRGQSFKKHRSKKLFKSFCRKSIQPIIPCVASQQKQDNVTLNLDLVKDRELMNGKHGATSPLICGSVVDNFDSNDKNRKVDSAICQSEMHSPKACGSKLSNFSANTLNGNGHVGFDTRTKLPNVSSNSLNGNNYIQCDISRLHEEHSPAEDLRIEQESIHATLSETSEEMKQRGRSKFERWTSHSEQVTHDLCFSMSNTQKVGRICLSKKVAASKSGQYLRNPHEAALGWMKRGDNCAVQSEAGEKRMAARKHEGKSRTTFTETDNKSTIRKNEQQTVQQHLDQFVAKLEKRRERFKLPMLAETQPVRNPAMKDEGESLQKRSTIKAVPLTDRFVERLERPARKRCWGGG